MTDEDGIASNKSKKRRRLVNTRVEVRMQAKGNQQERKVCPECFADKGSWKG
jgi:hypothetical protein